MSINYLPTFFFQRKQVKILQPIPKHGVRGNISWFTHVKKKSYGLFLANIKTPQTFKLELEKKSSRID